MSEVIEFVFEDVQLSRLSSLVSSITNYAQQVLSVECPEREQIALSSAEGLELLIGSADELSVFYKLANVSIGGVRAAFMLAEVVKYRGQCDVELSVWENDLRDSSVKALITTMARKMNELAAENGVHQWYSGLEPARDLETRYFTGLEMGPLKVK